MSLLSFSLLWFSNIVPLSTMNHFLFITSLLLQPHSSEHLFLFVQYPFVLFLLTVPRLSPRPAPQARPWPRSSQWVYSMPLAIEPVLKMGRRPCMVPWQSPISCTIVEKEVHFRLRLLKNIECKFGAMVGILSAYWRSLEMWSNTWPW